MVGVLGAIGTGATVSITIQAVDKFSKVLKNAESGFSKFANASKIAFAAVAVGISAVGFSAIKLAGDFEQTTVAFTTMLGSAEEAKKFLEELADFAKKTPFTLQGVEKSARQLLAVGFEAADVLPVLRDVGNVAAGLGLGEPGLERLILNLGQVQSQGKLTGRELRDFAVAGIPLLDELSKELGITTAAVSDLVSKGEIDTATVLKSFKNMASEGGRFANLMEEQAKTVQGRFSNLKDTLTLVGREIGMGLLPIVGELANVLLEEVLPSLKPVIEAIGIFLQKALEKLAPMIPEIASFFGEFVEVALELFEAISPLIEPLIDLGLVILPIVLDVIKALTPAVKSLANALAPLLELLIPVVEFLGKIISGISKIGGKVFKKIFDVVGGGTSRASKSLIKEPIVSQPKESDIIFIRQPNDNVTVNIENVNGLDSEMVSESMARQVNKVIRL